MSGILGKKIGMTRIVQNDQIIPVSVIECKPNEILQIKTSTKDGYPALVVGFDAYSKPGKNKKFKHVAEFRLQNDSEKKKGEAISVTELTEIKTVKITGWSKGRGTAGVIKRHHFHRGPETHGSHHHRQPGSNAGVRSGGGRTPRGKRFPGHMGTDQVTTARVPVVSIDAEKNLLIVKGPIPGACGGLIKITAN